MRWIKTFRRVMRYSQKVNNRYYTEININRSDVNKCFDEGYIRIIEMSFMVKDCEGSERYRTIFELTEKTKMLMEFDEL